MCAHHAGDGVLHLGALCLVLLLLLLLQTCAMKQVLR